MLVKDILKEVLKQRYNEDRAIPVNINASNCGVKNDEILVMFDTMNFSIVERFKVDIAIEDVFKVMDEATHKKDYEYAYYELKKFWNEHTLDKLAFKQVFGDSLFLLKDDEILVSIKDYVFSVSFNDDKISYKVNKLCKVNLKDKNTLEFENLNENKWNKPFHDEIEQGVIKLQENRKQAKKEVIKKGKELLSSMIDKVFEMQTNLKKIIDVEKEDVKINYIKGEIR
ncbi:hypothetical protein psyc5s11_36580 [Clostridium gelidum]|uniref:Uncharacterized protein n=1 Tax=Clostridium gelidum TaxID=704125 RepID=A0ABN6J0X8_9CLOT|nr:hypothetical protein [Clostridium gelidum]BCZ47591.1 hypothetical protein psyc5s11_36580 [Clostridium gelidum]